MICPQCNKEFIKSYRTQKYCSKECTKIYRKEYSKKYQKTVWANKVKEAKLKKAVIKVCIQCAKEFTPAKTTPYQKICSKKCRTSFGNSQVKKKGIRLFICEFCFKEFNSIRGKKYCSLKCGRGKNLEDVKKDPLRNENRLTKFRDRRQNRSEEQKIKDREAVVRYKSKNLEKVRASHRKSKKKWYDKDPEKANKLKYQHKKKRLARDPAFKIEENLRTRFHHWLKSTNITKEKNFSGIKTMVGCTRNELKLHLEKNFYNHKATGIPMTWSNYGKPKSSTDIIYWQVDHKRPLADFRKKEDISKFEIQCKMNHFSNLQPLWFEDNRDKSDKWIS
jgi:hypothetical protein